MKVTIPVDKMSTNEKIEAMELLWDDLCKSTEKVPVLDWHKDILDERQIAVAEGREKAVDWETATAIWR
ncbi:MAG TPA: addiction module protein, partial [Spirochaetota bacterium]|nr:addiction module protein [Spirochaetota bacterium]